MRIRPRILSLVAIAAALTLLPPAALLSLAPGTSTTATPAPAAAQTRSPELPTLLGWGAGNGSDFRTQLPQFRDETGGKTPAWSMVPFRVEQDWGQKWIPALLTDLQKLGTLPYIELTTQDTGIFRGTASGAEQARIDRMVATLGGWVKADPGRFITLAPFPEMNLTAHPWGGDPTRYKQAYHRIRAAFRDAGVGPEKLRLVFAPNGISSPGFGYPEFYPGDGAVDLVGFSKINRGDPWRDYQETFQRHIDEMRRTVTTTKPLLITQTGSVIHGGDRSGWLRDMFTGLASHPQVLGAVYFNREKTYGHGTFDYRVLRNGELDATFRTHYVRDWSDPSQRRFLVDGSLEAWVQARGGTPAARFADIARSGLREDITWVADEGITSGCRPDFYCPARPVTRAQMASFLARALDLPPSDEDRFTDDDGVHEKAIQAVAAAGITGGCNEAGTRYCPDQPVNRAQMAAFLARALDLPPSEEDRFTDDDGLRHEPAIQAVAAADITAGCTTTRFCPADSVTRAQMAAFLHRAVG